MALRKPPTKPAELFIENLPLNTLIPDPKNARRHTPQQITKLSAVIKDVAWSNPIVIDEGNVILAGHARLEAAKQLGLKHAPCVRLSHLSPAKKKALAIADNRIGDESSFDDEALRAALMELTDLDFNVELTGFETAEVDFLLDGPAGPSGSSDPDDVHTEPNRELPAISRWDDLWCLDEHRLLCGNALDASSYERLLGPDRAQMVFADCPYNVPINGHVSGLGKVKHPEFAMASGEMSEDEYKILLVTMMTHLANFTVDGSIHFLCIDFRHVAPMIQAGKHIYSALKNVCVWNKTNAGMGSLYRSQHELVVVFKNGTAPHVNNVQLGKYGRHRSNVWTYPGANTFSATQDADLVEHPTPKPIALVADAIRDCSKRKAIILDPFSGAGTTIMAAERTGRRAAAIEIDPIYVDASIRRWQARTGKPAVLADDGRTFEEVQRSRAGDFTDASASFDEEV